MNALYRLALADFLERVRRTSFVVTLLVVVAVTYFYLPALDAGFYPYLNLGGYRPIYNSAWIGAAAALLMAEFFPLFGFYLVKNTIERDRRTGVGEIIAATPVSASVYLLGKWLSNLAVFAAVLLATILAAGVLQLIRAEDFRLDLWGLAAPLLLVNLPIMALMAGLAVLFESLTVLRGGFGNLVYYPVYMILAIVGDLQGLQAVWPSVYRACAAHFERCNPARQIDIASAPLSLLPTFRFEGVAWQFETLLPRLLWIVFSIGVALLASVSFHRFDPARIGHSLLDDVKRRLLEFVIRPQPAATPARLDPGDEAAARPSRGSFGAVTLTPLAAEARAINNSLLWRMFLAELRLNLKGLPWLWYLGAGGLIVAGVVLPLDLARMLALPLAWVWPVLVWANLGGREVQQHTNPLLFSLPFALRRQLPLTWAVGFALALLMGSPILVRLLLAGSLPGFGAALVGALFIPSLALALGCWSGSGKLFQAIYLFAWYLATVQGVVWLDFMGHLPTIESGPMPLVYLALTAGLLAAAVLGRRRQLRQY